MKDYAEIYARKFYFRGKYLTLDEVGDWFKNKVKVYTESSHFDRILIKDNEGNYYLYEFYEYEGSYSGGEDLMYTTYVSVKDEADADELNKQRDIRRAPYFRVLPDYGMEIR